MSELEIEALETAEGGSFAHEIIDALEAELVRFRHRVRHDHGIELDRARAAMALLGKLVGAGVKWVAQPDSDPARIHEAFSTVIARDPKAMTLVKREVAAFFAATADVKVDEHRDDDVSIASTRLRRAGADPALWWWASGFSDINACWAATGDDADRVVQCALAFGVPVKQVVTSLAGVLQLLVTRLKLRSPRAELVDAIEALRTAGRVAEAGPITKLAFELAWKKDVKPDAVSELVSHAFQLVEAVHAAKAVPDVERFGAVAARIARMQAARGLQVAAIVRKDLDDAVRDL